MRSVECAREHSGLLIFTLNIALKCWEKRVVILEKGLLVFVKKTAAAWNANFIETLTKSCLANTLLIDVMWLFLVQNQDHFPGDQAKPEAAVAGSMQ